MPRVEGTIGVLESLEGFWRVLALGFESSHEHRTTSNLMTAENVVIVHDGCFSEAVLIDGLGGVGVT